jgi:membrane associated rhomboid family serine protease
MTARDIAFVVFGLFVALSASYVAYQIAIAVGLGVASAGPIAGLVFAVTAIMIDRKRPSRNS